MPTWEPERVGSELCRAQHRSLRALDPSQEELEGLMGYWPLQSWANTVPSGEISLTYRNPRELWLYCFDLLQICFLFLISSSMFSELQGTFKILMIISDINNQPSELSFFVPGDLVSPVSLSFPQTGGEQLILLQQRQYFTSCCLSFSIINLPNAACHFIINQLGKKACLLI